METDRLPLGERIAVLETKFDQWEADLRDISTKLDTLLELKQKGMGALWFVWIIVGSGVLGGVSFITNLFSNKPHL